MITFLTGMVELFAPACLSIKPRFGEEHGCTSFSRLPSQSLWFFFPIGTFIGINAVLFVLIAHRIRSLDKEKRSLGIKDRTSEMDRLMSNQTTEIEIILQSINQFFFFAVSLFY